MQVPVIEIDKKKCHFWLNKLPLNKAAPSLQTRFVPFITTTGCLAPVPGIGLAQEYRICQSTSVR